MDAKQSGRSDTVLWQVVVTFVQITLGETKQRFLLKDKASIRFKYKDASTRLVSNRNELVTNLAFQGRNQTLVGLLTGIRHHGCLGRHCSQYLLLCSLSLLWNHNEGFNLRNCCGVKDHRCSQHTCVDCFDNVANGSRDSLCTLCSVLDYVFFNLGKELSTVTFNAIVLFQTINLRCWQRSNLRTNCFFDYTSFNVNNVGFVCYRLSSSISACCLRLLNGQCCASRLSDLTDKFDSSRKVSLSTMDEIIPTRLFRVSKNVIWW